MIIIVVHPSGGLGKQVTALFAVLSANIHLFDPELGLVMRPGVPDPASAKLLKCIADAFDVPVVEVGSLRTRFAASPFRALLRDCCAPGPRRLEPLRRFLIHALCLKALAPGHDPQAESATETPDA